MRGDLESSAEKRASLAEEAGRSPRSAGFKYHQGAGAGGVGAEPEQSPTLTADWHNQAVYPIDEPITMADLNATTALNNAEYNRQGLIGKYPGQSLATLLAGEVSGSTTIYDALHKRVQAANFSGMRVGDYIDVPLVSASAITGQQSVRFLLAHFDPYYQCGDSAKGHHIAFIASAPVAVAKTVTGVANDSYLMWNTADTNQGTADVKNPYLNSNLKAWEKLFEACLPEGLTKYLLTQRVLLEERYSASGALSDSNSWSWQDIGKVWSPSEMEVYGCPVWGTKGYSVGFDCQFDLFRDTAHRLNGTRRGWWLRSVMGGSSSYVCDVGNTGSATYTSAARPWVRPRPGFLVG